MVALFLDHNKTNDDADGKEISKNGMFILTNNNFARASHYFVHFFAVVALHMVPQKLSPRFSKLNEIE